MTIDLDAADFEDDWLHDMDLSWITDGEDTNDAIDDGETT